LPHKAFVAWHITPQVLTDKRRNALRSATYGPTPFSPRDSQGSCQSAEQGDTSVWSTFTL
jgi:hypothetical protein